MSFGSLVCSPWRDDVPLNYFLERCKILGFRGLLPLFHFKSPSGIANFIFLLCCLLPRDFVCINVTGRFILVATKASAVISVVIIFLYAKCAIAILRKKTVETTQSRDSRGNTGALWPWMLTWHVAPASFQCPSPTLTQVLYQCYELNKRNYGGWMLWECDVSPLTDIGALRHK